VFGRYLRADLTTTLLLSIVTDPPIRKAWRFIRHSNRRNLVGKRGSGSVIRTPPGDHSVRSFEDGFFTTISPTSGPFSSDDLAGDRKSAWPRDPPPRNLPVRSARDWPAGCCGSSTFKKIGRATYKAEIIAADPVRMTPISLYGQGDWEDLLPRPNTCPSTGKLKAFQADEGGRRITGRGDSRQ